MTGREVLPFIPGSSDFAGSDSGSPSAWGSESGWSPESGWSTEACWGSESGCISEFGWGSDSGVFSDCVGSSGVFSRWSSGSDFGGGVGFDAIQKYGSFPLCQNLPYKLY